MNSLAIFGLDLQFLVLASFDGASSISREHGGVKALLKQLAPFTGTLPQPVVEMKQVLLCTSKLYALFSNSPPSPLILKCTFKAVGEITHKLVQPAAARWLLHEGSTLVVIDHYCGTCLALEAIYVEDGDLPSYTRELCSLFARTVLRSSRYF